jgi:hypothetical protein
VASIVPVDAADRDLAPVYPGISDSPSLRDWNPPFPIDLRRIRPVDEAYWEKYRTTPKAFVPLEVGQRLWRSRYGAVTSVRVAPPQGQSLVETRSDLEQRLRASIDPLTMGIAVRDVRAQGLAASRGATDFGAYFVYFSFFLVVSALLLASLFFKLGIEQRVREVGLLRAVGFGPAAIRRLFTGEGLLLAIAGSALGVLGAVGYAAMLMLALRTWWVDAVGTTALTLHVSASSLGRWCDRRNRRRHHLHLVDPPEPGAHFRAEPPGRGARVRRVGFSTARPGQGRVLGTRRMLVSMITHRCRPRSDRRRIGGAPSARRPRSSAPARSCWPPRFVSPAPCFGSGPAACFRDADGRRCRIWACGARRIAPDGACCRSRCSRAPRS